MSVFRPKGYFRPDSISDAISLLMLYEDSRIIAGGTDVLVIKDPRIKYLIDITGTGFDDIRSEKNTIRVGALATFRTISRCSIFQDPAYAALTKAADSVGSIAIRNVATIGGNICSAVPSADSVPPLLVLDAVAHIEGSSGHRQISLEHFFSGSKRTVLQRGEVLVEVEIRNLPSRTASSFSRMIRSGGDIALVNVAVRMTLGPKNTCRNVRIALGAVAPTPIRSARAEKQLEGHIYGRGTVEKASEAASLDARPITDIRASAEYRSELVRVLVKRSLEDAYQRVITS
jgi:aerobic carbon-monoxide dehydrogenase medium subunit